MTVNRPSRASSAEARREPRPKELLRRHFSGVDTLTLEDATRFAQTITSSYGNMTQVALSPCEFMVRVSKEKFASDANVHFDVARTDRKLAALVGDRPYVPIRALGDDLRFLPPCGYRWNPFLLESFVRRFSKKYRLVSSYHSSSLTSIVVPRDSEYKREREIIADALNSAGIAPDRNDARAWLVAQGFRAAPEDASQPAAAPAPQPRPAAPVRPAMPVRPAAQTPPASPTRYAAPTTRKLPTENLDALRSLLEEEYPNGFWRNSESDLDRLQELAAENGYAALAVLGKSGLSYALAQVGVPHGAKLYVLPDDLDARLCDAVADVARDGARILYYAKLHERLMDQLPYWFDAEFLRERLEATRRDLASRLPDDLIPKFPAPEYLVLSDVNVVPASEYALVAAEIQRVWGDAQVCSAPELAERLPLVPEDRVLPALRRDEFLHNKKDEYALWSSIEFFDDTVDAARDAVRDALKTRGYLPIGKLPVGKMHVFNEELELDAVQRALLRYALKGECELSYHNIVPRGESLNIISVVKDFCKERTQVSYTEIVDYMKEIFGEKNHFHTIINGAYDSMVRISREDFVADELVNFDVEQIDDAIDAILGEAEYLPIQAFMMISHFPPCGYVWNQHLLESFAYRFSRRFRLRFIHRNMRNVGAIARADSRFTTLPDIIADAVAKSLCKLDKDSVLHWLKDNGYLGTLVYAQIDNVVEYASRYRKGML